MSIFKNNVPIFKLLVSTVNADDALSATCLGTFRGEFVFFPVFLLFNIFVICQYLKIMYPYLIILQCFTTISYVVIFKYLIKFTHTLIR